MNGDARTDHDNVAEAKTGIVGRVISVKGSQCIIGLTQMRGGGSDEPGVTVGKSLGINHGSSLLVGVVTQVALQLPSIARDQGFQGTAQIDLMGEITLDSEGKRLFQRGVTTYPVIGDDAVVLGSQELRTLYDLAGANLIEIGRLQQDQSIGAFVDVNEMLNKHFAVLGTTGVGKSSGVALILRETLRARPDLRIFLVDVHNEYARCFDDRANVVNPRNLKLPFWLFNFEETIDVFFGGRPGVEDEVEILAEVLPLAKASYVQYKNGGEQASIKRGDLRSSGFTVDTPVPYRLVDLVSLIDERLGKLENRASRPNYSRLISRIETVSNNPRYGFIFDNANVGGDTMAEILSNLFRVPADGMPVTVMQLAGFPAEVVDAVVSVICRMAFDFGLWSEGSVPLLFVCEEAHRYASADHSIGFGPTRKAVSRIAKEGRKYGVFLGLVTQRPAELDPTIISQCSTLFAMRMTNERDQALLRSAVSDGAAHLLAFVPSLGTREVFAFGQGVALPTRMKFNALPPDLLRKGDAVITSEEGSPQTIGRRFLSTVIDRWRGATMREKFKLEDPAQMAATMANIRPEQASAPPNPLPPTYTPAPSLNPDKFKILKKPLASEPARPQTTFGARWSGK